MGARQSRRSVDITTTPKKGEEGSAVVEGEGKLEKIAEPDLKVTTNGTLHNTAEIEFADKEEIAKDQSPAEKDVCEPEVKENGLPEGDSPEQQNGSQEKDNVATTKHLPQVQEITNSKEKTPESDECKTELAEAKKAKKEKKKKWSFRSISFSKKDKSKPNKDTEKNGEVKEVTEEAAAENETPSQVQSPVEETAKPTDSSEVAAKEAPVEEVKNISLEETERPSGDSPKPSAAEPSAPKPQDEEVKPVVEEPVTTIDEHPQEKAVTPPVTEEVVSKEPEPVVEQPVETAPPKEQVAQPVEVTHPAEETTTVDEETTKEVRSTQEIPPPLPSSNPPSPVTVFAESTKADAYLPADQVPLEIPLQESNVVDISSSIKQNEVEAVIPVGESLVQQPEVVKSLEGLADISSDVSVVTQIKEEDLPEIPVESSTVIESESVEPVNVKEVPVPKDTEVVPEPPVTDTSETVEEVPPPVPEELICPLLTSIDTKTEPLTPPTTPAAISEPISRPLEIETPVEADLPAPPVVESEKSIAETLISETEPTVDKLVKSTEQLPEVAAPNDVDSLVESTEPLPDPSSVVSELVPRGDSLPDISLDSLPSLPEPVSEGLPEPMSLPPVDSVPEPIASDSDFTARLLPEPVVSDSNTTERFLAEPIAYDSDTTLRCIPEPIAADSDTTRVLPPADSIPEPIASDSELTTPLVVAQPDISSSIPKDAFPHIIEGTTPVVLTNGNATNGLPTTPSDEVIVEPTVAVSGPLKQVPTDVSNDSEVKEAGDKPSEKVAETAAVQE